jgi:hypothetical protein
MLQTWAMRALRSGKAHEDVQSANQALFAAQQAEREAELAAKREAVSKMRDEKQRVRGKVVQGFISRGTLPRDMRRHGHGGGQQQNQAGALREERQVGGPHGSPPSRPVQATGRLPVSPPPRPPPLSPAPPPPDRVRRAQPEPVVASTGGSGGGAARRRAKVAEHDGVGPVGADMRL